MSTDAASSTANSWCYAVYRLSNRDNALTAYASQ